MTRLNLSLIIPAVAAGAAVFIAAVLTAHAYGRRQERRAYPKRVIKP